MRYDHGEISNQQWDNMAVQLGLGTGDLDDLMDDPTRRGDKVRGSTFARAMRVVQRSGNLELVAEWKAAAPQKYRGGAKRKLTDRQVLTALQICLFEGVSPTAMNVQEVLFERLTYQQCVALGLDPKAAQPWPEAAAQAVRRVIRSIVATFDAWPFRYFDERGTEVQWDRRKEPLQEHWDRILEWRAMHADELAEKEQRARLFANNFAEASARELPAQFWPAKLTVMQDATFFKVNARAPEYVGKDETPSPKRRMGMEPDGGMHKRAYRFPTADGGVRTSVKSLGWGVEAETQVVTSPDPDRPDAFPNLMTGAFVHYPNESPGDNMLAMLKDFHERRGYDFEDVLGDQAYLASGRNPELHAYIWRNGGKVVGKTSELNETGLQQQDGVHGAAFSDGRYYCPAAPHLDVRTWRAAERRRIRATMSGPAKEAALAEVEQSYRDQMLERRAYALRDKETRDIRGNVKRMCPAVGPSATVKCALKPQSPSVVPEGRSLLPVENPPNMDEAGAICTNKQSVTFTPEDEGTFGQYYEPYTPEWDKHVNRRNIVESRYTVTGDKFHFKRASHRKGRGLARHVLDLSVIVSAYNVQTIRDWLLERVERLHESGTLDAPPNARGRRARTASAAQRIRWLRKQAVHDRRESERQRDRRRKHPVLS